MHQIQVLDDLSIVANRCVVARLEPSEAFDLAEQLVRSGIRRAMLDESAKVLFEGEDSGAGFERDTRPVV